MRVSNISQFLGGADNVKALEIIDGEQRTFTGTLQDSNNTAMDISSSEFEISAVGEYYTASVQESGRSLSLSSLTRDSTVSDFDFGSSNVVTDPYITKLTGQTGQFTITIPANIYSEPGDNDEAPHAAGKEAAADTTTDVPLLIIWVSYRIPDTPVATIRKSRIVVIIRRGA